MVKSAVSVLICLLMLCSLCACTTEREVVMSEFCKEVSFTLDEVNVKGELNFKNKDNITFTIIEPQNLEGIIFTESQISKDDVTINYSKMKDGSPIFILLSIIKSLAESQIYRPYEGEYTMTGAVSSADYKIIFDCEKEEIKSIEMGKFAYKFE